jgi:glycosyltransferase involved in cell wall biosynthesis
MSAKRVLVCWPKVLYVRGGTEVQVLTLVQKLKEASVETDTIELPLQHWPNDALLRSMALWRLLDLKNGDGSDVDLLIATKFPSYFVQHPKKIVWLTHQFRQIYDWYETEYSAFKQPRSDNYQVLKWIVEHDRQSLEECKVIYTISNNVRERLLKYLGINAEVLYPPPSMEGKYYCRNYEPFILIVQRLEANKRTELLIRSLQHLKGNYRVQIVGTGPEEIAVRNCVNELHLNDRVDFQGRVSSQYLLELYATCRLVFYAPFDEDYGYVPIEAFLSKKPVVTSLDSGGPLEFVRHQINGWIAEPNSEALAQGLQRLLDDASLAQVWGEKGFQQYSHFNWKNTINTLLKHVS